jgi:hypothetical protein
LNTSNADVYSALRERGCPLCRTVSRNERRNVASFLREGRVVPSARAQFVRAGGFCPSHTWMLHEAAAVEASGAGIADLYGLLLDQDLEALDRASSLEGKRGWRDAARRIAARGRCPMCVDADQVQRRQAAFLCELLDDEAGRRAFRDSDGLCRGHLRTTLEESLRRHPKGEGARLLLEDWRARLATLRKRLAEYDRKRSYTAAKERTAADERAWTDVIERYAGS